ncbi:hypothetical protein LWI28_005450 [Acer negundo]|uniref:Uncharacterized protein n=1 Tax=Acer negundo TaxID=4023 RepID=A0AAD5J9H8_ACENE|nr:hypothetical protein LWI28_005450 [Acer negundo]
MCGRRSRNTILRIQKQILEEQEHIVLHQLQEQAGLIPRQEQLDFLYDSGLAIGRSDNGGGVATSGSGF